jgi:hypothetical protein
MIQAADLQHEIDRFRERHDIAAVGAAVVANDGDAVAGAGGTISSGRRRGRRAPGMPGTSVRAERR